MNRLREYDRNVLINLAIGAVLFALVFAALEVRLSIPSGIMAALGLFAILNAIRLLGGWTR